MGHSKLELDTLKNSQESCCRVICSSPPTHVEYFNTNEKPQKCLQRNLQSPAAAPTGTHVFCQTIQMDIITLRIHIRRKDEIKIATQKALRIYGCDLRCDAITCNGTKDLSDELVLGFAILL